MPPFSPLSAITFLKTKDMQATTRFYTNILGFELILDQEYCRIFRICPNCHLGFCLTEGETGSPEIILTLEIPDVDGYHSHLQSLEFQVEIPPRLNEKFNIYQMFLRDPNGYLIEVQRFLDPKWDQARQIA
jgi:catechol 2,3-dioxygenase-like lactoylglutathione lyase family enzyme